MSSRARAAVEHSDGSAFAFFLRETLELHLAHCDVAGAFAAFDADHAADTSDLTLAFERVLARAQRDGEVRSDFSTKDLERLMCGVEFAVRMGDPRTQSERSARYVEVLLLGLRPRH